MYRHVFSSLMMSNTTNMPILDLNACLGSTNCDANAACIDQLPPSVKFSCMCNVGYVGNGFHCDGELLVFADDYFYQ